jgi:hypothetical protein
VQLGVLGGNVQRERALPVLLVQGIRPLVCKMLNRVQRSAGGHGKGPTPRGRSFVERFGGHLSAKYPGRRRAWRTAPPKWIGRLSRSVLCTEGGPASTGPPDSGPHPRRSSTAPRSAAATVRSGPSWRTSDTCDRTIFRISSFGAFFWIAFIMSRHSFVLFAFVLVELGGSVRRSGRLGSDCHDAWCPLSCNGSGANSEGFEQLTVSPAFGARRFSNTAQTEKPRRYADVGITRGPCRANRRGKPEGAIRRMMDEALGADRIEHSAVHAVRRREAYLYLSWLSTGVYAL